MLANAASPKALPDDPACTAADRAYMKEAYQLAGEAVKSGNAPLALLVVDGKVVAKYMNNVARAMTARRMRSWA